MDITMGGIYSSLIVYCCTIPLAFSQVDIIFIGLNKICITSFGQITKEI